MIGLNGIITGNEWDYTAKIKSKKAIIIEIDREIMHQERRNFKKLDEEIEKVDAALKINGQPHVDFLCRFELLGDDELEEIIQNFKKQILYNQNKHSEIENFD